ncbi:MULTISPECIES: hypothetical protein [unclassified Pseudodesulfovibrio]|uniref:hypothetical protein n=1 Tax=unclassified Pseudodesulfovibrio TaxID=2661612 RepID=UPI000FEB92AE|nr:MULTISPECIES: hypothetical protein [unclassified Pseudodesulfovibrio]MCJ2164209.1 hypothetical protein [Pseudodesulfovibrio sp. S3-i]RWU05167.1 hypothetical protein DWB63_05795 [Pseudodesulfovibrio sp. S3]
MKITDHGGCGTVCTFSFTDKLLARTTFSLGMAVGMYGIWLSSPTFALAYLVYAVGSYFLLMRYTVCARCPHLFQANDCLFAPASSVKRFVAPRSGPLTVRERLILVCAVFGTAAIPVYWLVFSPWLLVLYALLAGGCFLGLVMRICRKCQVEVCPMNRNVDIVRTPGSP